MCKDNWGIEIHNTTNINAIGRTNTKYYGNFTITEVSKGATILHQQSTCTD